MKSDRILIRSELEFEYRFGVGRHDNNNATTTGPVRKDVSKRCRNDVGVAKMSMSVPHFC